MPVVSGSNTSQNTSQKKLNFFQKNWKTMALCASVLANVVLYSQNKTLKEEFKEEMGINSFRGNFDNEAFINQGAYAQVIKTYENDPGEVNIYVPKGEDGNAEKVIASIPLKP